MYQSAQIFHVLRIITVYFVEHQLDRHAVRLRRSQEAVDEDSRRNRIVHRYDEQGLIDVGSDDVGQFREV